MKRTVVYGLGRIYRRHARTIERDLNVVAHCDKNPEVVNEFSDGITVEELARRQDEFDEVFVTASLMNVYPYLVDEVKIPQTKIKVLGYDYMSNRGGQPSTRFYGGNGEDMVLQLLLERMGISLKEAKYVEIGSNSPVQGNNSYFLYAAGARGVLVDPMPLVARLSQVYRPEDKFIQAAVTDLPKSDTAMFYESSVVSSSSLHEDFVKDFDSKEGRHIVNSYTVPLLGINDLLEQAGFVPDVLLVDAEGEDDTIVRGIDFEKYHPRIIIVETDHCDEESLVKFVTSKGYEWFTTVHYTNAIFVDEGRKTK